MHAIEAEIINFLHDLYQAMGWPGVVLAMAIESAAIPLPSEIIMPLAGWMLVETPAGLFWAGIWGAVGNVIGSVVAYWIGARWGRAFFLRYGRYVLITPHEIELADRWFARYGEATTFFSRLLPVVRTFISVPAGVARMHFGKFVVYTFLGAFPWSFLLAWGGYLFGQNWEELRAMLRPFDIPILIAGLAGVAWFFYHRIKSVRAHPVQSESGSLSSQTGLGQGPQAG